MLHINKTTLRKHKKAILISSGAIITVIAITVLGFAMPGIIRSYKYHAWQKQKQAKINQYLNKSLKIDLSSFSTDVQDGNIVGNLKVTVKNISNKLAFYSIVISAVTPKGNTLFSDIITVFALPPQKEQQFFVFNRPLNPREERLLKISTFKVSDISPLYTNTDTPTNATTKKDNVQNTQPSQNNQNDAKATLEPTQQTKNPTGQKPTTRHRKHVKH